MGAPMPPPEAAHGATPIQNTLVGMAPPVPPAASYEARTETWERAAERALAAGISPEGPTPLEVPISGSGVPRSAGAKNGADSRPSGVAKVYVPKHDANMPPVVVDEEALKAGQAAAQAEQARRKRNRRSANAITIPGNVRVVPRGPGLTPTIEPIDAELEAAFRPSRAPWIIGLMLVAGVAVGTVLFVRTTGEPPKPPAAVLKPAAPAPQAEPPAIPSPDTAATTAASSAPPDGSAAATAPSSSDSAASASSRRGTASRAATPHATQPAAAPHKPAPKRAPATSGASAPAGVKGKATIVRETPF